MRKTRKAVPERTAFLINAHKKQCLRQMRDRVKKSPDMLRRG